MLSPLNDSFMCRATVRNNLRVWGAIKVPEFVKNWIKNGVKIPFQVNGDKCSYEF